MQIVSPSFQPNQSIPGDFTCKGEGINPPLLFKDVPEETKTMLLIVDDPDAPGRPFVHWLVWNIDHEVREIPIDSVPELAFQGRNSAGEIGWIAPCPPSGIHHYHFMLYALNTTLNVAEGAEREEVEASLDPTFIVAKAELVGTVSR